MSISLIEFHWKEIAKLILVNNLGLISMLLTIENDWDIFSNEKSRKLLYHDKLIKETVREINFEKIKDEKSRKLFWSKILIYYQDNNRNKNYDSS